MKIPARLSLCLLSLCLPCAAQSIAQPQGGTGVQESQLTWTAGPTGRFVAAIPASTLGADGTGDGLKILPVALPDKPWPVAMITLKNRTLSPAAQQFVETARRCGNVALDVQKSRVRSGSALA